MSLGENHSLSHTGLPLTTHFHYDTEHDIILLPRSLENQDYLEIPEYLQIWVLIVNPLA